MLHRALSLIGLCKHVNGSRLGFSLWRLPCRTKPRHCQGESWQADSNLCAQAVLDEKVGCHDYDTIERDGACIAHDLPGHAGRVIAGNCETKSC